MPSRTDINRRSEMSSRKDDRDRDRNRKNNAEKKHSSEHNSSQKRDTIKSSQKSSSRRSPPPKHSSKTDRPKVEDENDRRNRHRPEKSSSSLRASNSHHSTGRNEDGNRREAKKIETLKRPRSKSPIQRHRTDQDRKHRRTEQENPAKKSERKEIVVKKEEPVMEFGNSGFGNSGFGNSGFGDSSGGFKKPGSNFGLNSNFGGSGNFNNKTFGRREHNNDVGKSRIAGPNDGYGIENKQEQSGLKMVIVNELSMDSIKRDEHPLKGTMTTKRTRGGGPFIGQRNAVGRGGGNQNSFGMARGPTGGFGARGGFNNSGRPNFDRTAEPPNSKDVRYSSSRNSINEQGDGGKSVDSDEKPPLNPLAVPRGRNYFLHDHRDAIADDNRLYDPRLDRGGSSFRRGTGTRERGGGRGGPPIGWRNFEDTDGNEKESAGAFSRRGGRGGFTRGGGFAGDEPATDGSRQSWRSKADEDRVWKHDKYMEISQEEVDTKLELVDEADADGEQTMDGSKEDGRQRYQQEDEYLEYETEEMVPYD